MSIGDHVTRIGDNAFYLNHLKSVDIPDSVTSIGGYAFRNNQLASLTIGKSVASIGYHAFSENQLTEIVIPGNVTSIEHHAFYNNQLKSAAIGEGVERIGNYAFGYNQLVSVAIPATVDSITSDAFDGNQTDPSDLTVYGESGSVAEKLAESKGYTFIQTNVVYEYRLIDFGKEVEITGCTGPGGDIAIPSQLEGKPVTRIAEEAFKWKKLTEGTIPEGVTYIGTGAFYGNDLTRVRIPDSVATVGYGAFASNKLKNVTIGEGVSSIASYAFDSNQLDRVIIPGNVTSVNSNAFNGNQADPSDLIVYGEAGSAAEGMAVANGYAFRALIKIEFSDMSQADWFFDTVSQLVAIGGISGYPDGSFRPDEIMRRGEFVKLIVVGMGHTIENADDAHWAMRYVRKAESLGILDRNEFSEGSLDKGITRSEMAKIAVRAMELEENLETVDFRQFKELITDYDSIDSGHQGYVLEAYANGILTGYPDREFKGGNTLSRAEAATVAIRVLNPEKRMNNY